MEDFNENKYKYSIFSRFISILFLVFISLVLCIGWKLTKMKSDNNLNDIENSSLKIIKEIESDIFYIDNKLQLIGELIVSKRLSDNESSILNILNSFSDNNKKTKIIINEVGWINSNYILNFISSNTNSVVQNIKKLDHTYERDISDSSFKLLFAKLARGNKKEESIISIIMSFKDIKGKYLGSLTSGISILHLKRLLKESFKYNKDISYSLYNHENKENVIYSDNFKDIENKKILSLFIDSNLKKIRYMIKGKSYISYKIENSPLILIVGLPKVEMSYKDFLLYLIYYKIEIFISLSILCCLIYLFYVSILQPFVQLSRAALFISKGKLDIKIPQINSTEGDLVAAALEKIRHYIKVEKELVAEVLETRNKLSITNLRLEHKVNERTKELKDALQAKISLFNHLNHEIISPIQGICNISENILKFSVEISEYERNEYINQISYTAKRLYKKVSNLLDFSKFSTNAIQLNLSKINLSELTLQVINECNVMYAYQKSVKFNFTSNNPIYLMADKDRIAQLLFNLFVNAIKFSPNNGDIAINILPTNLNIGSSHYEAINFTVLDRGVGLVESEISSLFVPFVQGKNFVNKPGSIGLGLSICKEIVLAHNGKIWAANNKDGGASFNFILPLVQPKKNDKESNKPTAIDLHHVVPNILMIDDEDVCLNSMELLVFNSQYNLIKANSGQEGLKYLHNHYKSISLIMLDLMMPDMYGLNVLAEIRENPKFSSIPVILQTGTSDEDEVMKAFDMGISSFIRKPYKKQEVLEEIRKSLIIKTNI